MPVAPSGQATSFTSSSITSSAATVGWTRGDGDGVLVVARAGGAVNTDPTDGTNYTANAAFGSGTQIGTGNYVVYKGTGTSVNVTGLSAATTYYFELYEYNTNGLMHNMSGLIGNLTTSNGAPTVTTSAATSVSSTTATLNGNPTADGGVTITDRGFVYSTTDTTPTIGEAGVTQVSLSGTMGAMSTALSSLSPNTTYYFNTYAINSEGTAYGTAQTFTTAQLSVPTTLAASAITSTSFTANWNAVNGATGYQLDVYTGSSSTVSLYSANFNSFTGSGFASSPTAGQLDSDDWMITGMSEGATTFGGSSTTGDFAVGASTGGVTTGGIYAFTVGTGNVALGVQPTANDWAPGTIVLRVQNTTGTTLNSLEVSYKIWVLNDQGRSNSFNFSHSANNTTYTGVTALDYTSTATADTAPAWVPVNRSTTITGLNIANNAYYYLRWSGADVAGTGSRDEFALDDVQVSSTTS
ncbi:hypothetical protein EBX31_12725, partial [bacterium]|nr:hypothetical protein [bacterium]